MRLYAAVNRAEYIIRLRQHCNITYLVVSCFLVYREMQLIMVNYDFNIFFIKNDSIRGGIIRD